MNTFFSILYQEWFWEIFIGLVVLIFVNVFLRRLLRLIIKNKAEEKFELVFLKPIRLFISLIVVFYILDIVIHKFELQEIRGYLSSIRNLFIVISLCWIAMLVKKEFCLYLKYKRKDVDYGSVELLSKLLSITFIFVSFLIILQLLGLNIMPLVAFGGVGAAAVGFAAKDIIANFFGGMMIHLTKSFHCDDLIEMPKENIMGVVENIGWYVTTIRDLEKKPIYMPNSVFSTTYVKNFSRRSHRRVEEKVGIRYQDIDQVNVIVEEIKELLKTDSKVDHRLSNYVYLSHFAEYSLEIEMKVYVIGSDYASFVKVRQNLLLGIQKIISKHDASIAYPTNIVEIVSEK